MEADGAALCKRIMACLANVEVEAVGAGDIAFRSALRKCLQSAQVLAKQVSEDKKMSSLTPALFEAFRFIALMHGVMAGGSFCGHTSARDFWAEELHGVSHVSIEDLKKALLLHLPKQCGSAWLNRLSFEGHGVAEKDFAAMTDELGLAGGIARAANRVAYILSPPGSATLQIASTWDDDLRAGKPLRQALESLGTINKWAEVDVVGGMAIEMVEDDAVTAATNRNNAPIKGLAGHAVMRSAETVDQAYARLPSAVREETDKSILLQLYKESCNQADFLVSIQAKAREMQTQASDAGWRERMQVLLEILRRLIAMQTIRRNALLARQNALKEEIAKMGPAKGFQKLLQPIRKASSSALATLSEKRRSSATASDDLPLRMSSGVSEGARLPVASLAVIAEDEITPRRRAASIGPIGTASVVRPIPVSVATKKSDSTEDESSEPAPAGSTSLRNSNSSFPPVGSAASLDTSTASSSPPVAASSIPEAKKGSLTRSRKTSTSGGSRRKSRTLKVSSEEDAAAQASASGSAPVASGSISADDTTDMVFGKVFEQLRVAQAALQAREEKLKLREGRLRAKKKTLLKRQQAHAQKAEETRAQLDERERALETREMVYEARMKKLTRLQKEEHMRNLIGSFTDAQVVPLQRALRSWMCRRALAKACKLVLTAEPFRDARRRNAALSEIFTSEVAHVGRMEQMSLFRSLMNEQFPAGGRHAFSPAQFAKLFAGLDEAIDASKILLKELGICKSEFPKSTRVASVFEKWCPQHMTAYKQFVNNYDLSTATLQELRSKKAFVEFEQQMAARGLHALDSLLICPIQRLPRYRLLLEALVSFTPDEHCDKKSLLNAVELVRAAVEEVNRGKAVAEKMQVLLSLDEIVYGQDPSFPVIVSNRQLVFKGQLGDVMDPRAPLKQYFLFNDAMFEMIPRKKNLMLTARRSTEEYDFSRAFILGGSGVEMHEIPPSVMSNGFTIKNTLRDGNWKEQSFFAPSPQDLRAWVVALKNLRRLHGSASKKVSCQGCGTMCAAGVDRCHVCKASLETEEKE